MNKIKEYISIIASSIGGFLALIMSISSGMITKTSIPSISTKTSVTKAYKVITDSKLLTQAKEVGLENKFLTMKVFSIILMIFAVILLVYSVVALLKQLNVIKNMDKIISIFGVVIAISFIVMSIAVLITSIQYANSIESIMSDLIKIQTAGLGKVSINIGFYQPFTLITSILCGTLITYNEISSLKR